VNAIPASSASHVAESNFRSEDVSNQAASDNPFDRPISAKSDFESPYAAPMDYANQAHQGGYTEHHRGGLIITLGVFSILCNLMLVPGILAWAFGSGDLKKMNAGQMDRSGYGLTQAGMILGIVSTCLFLAAIVLYVVMILFVIIMGVAGAAAGSLFPIG
jgi:hypothetical protein